MVEKRIKMAREDRAKQFMPFAVLRGYQDLVNNTKTVKCSKRELTSEQEVELSNKILGIKKHDVVKILYYDNGFYVELKGAVTSVDFTFRKITVIKKEISFDDILEIN